MDGRNVDLDAGRAGRVLGKHFLWEAHHTRPPQGRPITAATSLHFSPKRMSVRSSNDRCRLLRRPGNSIGGVGGGGGHGVRTVTEVSTVLDCRQQVCSDLPLHPSPSRCRVFQEMPGCTSGATGRCENVHRHAQHIVLFAVRIFARNHAAEGITDQGPSSSAILDPSSRFVECAVGHRTVPAQCVDLSTNA